jgi:uncharacterized protein YukE
MVHNNNSNKESGGRKVGKQLLDTTTLQEYMELFNQSLHNLSSEIQRLQNSFQMLQQSFNRIGVVDNLDEYNNWIDVMLKYSEEYKQHLNNAQASLPQPPNKQGT